MHRRVVRHFLFPLHEMLRRRRTLPYLAELERNQQLSADEMMALQWRKLKRLLGHAYETVPYYRQLFQTLGATPDDIRTMVDFQKVPILTREIIRERLLALKSSSPRGRVLDNRTGGSSGQPLIFYSDSVKEAIGNAGKLRCRRWWGLEIGDPELNIWGNPVELSRAGQFQAWKDGLLNLKSVSAYDLSPESLLRWVELFKRHRPRSLYVYPSALVHFCEFLEHEGIDLRPWAPEYVVSTAETLFPSDRAKVERTLGTRVIYEYGAHDGCAVMAHDCPCGAMHTMDDLVLLEVTKNGAQVGPHELGELLVTSLDGYGMPFIRYAIGDMARQGAARCAMGRGFRSLEALEGRVGELLYHADGTPQSALYFTGFFRNIPGVRQFQIVQKGRSSFIIRMVVRSDYEPQCEPKIKAFMRKGLGDSIQVECEYVDEIKRSASGKVRWIINGTAQDRRSPNWSESARASRSHAAAQDTSHG